MICEYVLEFMSTISFKDHVVELDVNDMLVFQLGGLKRRMIIREFSVALGLYSVEGMNNNLFAFYHANCKSLLLHHHQSPVHRLVHRLLTLSVTGRYSGKGKVTLADLFYLHSMDGGEFVDIPWHVARFLNDKAKGVQKKSKIVGAHLIGRIPRHFGLMSSAALRVVTRGQETTPKGFVLMMYLLMGSTGFQEQTTPNNYSVVIWMVWKLLTRTTA
ncbi:hypothetical protein Tco_0898534 [Tanacetum coccineum]